MRSPAILFSFRLARVGALATCASLFAQPSAFGLSDVFNVPDGDWNTAANWTLNAVPGSGDTAFIRGDRVANINSLTTPDVQFLVIANNQVGSATVNVNPGGQLSITGGGGTALQIGIFEGATGLLNVAGTASVTGTTVIGTSASNGTLTVAGTGSFTTNNLTLASGGTGTVNVNGGSFNLTNTGDTFIGARLSGSVAAFNQTAGIVQVGTPTNNGRLIIGSPLATSPDVTGSMTISGGSIMSRFIVGNNVTGIPQNAGSLTISGSTASISSTATIGNGLEIRTSGSLIFEFDAVGISTMHFPTSTLRFDIGANLLVDGTDYTGPGGTFTLVNAGGLSNSNFANIDESVFGFAPNYTATLSFDTINNDLLLTVVPVPEPSAALLLFGGLGMFALRRSTRGSRQTAH